MIEAYIGRFRPFTLLAKAFTFVQWQISFTVDKIENLTPQS